MRLKVCGLGVKGLGLEAKVEVGVKLWVMGV